ncbi:MAG: exodeoxyribonuclease VII small subunit [Chloroflexi bacterium]|nr:MAG: exodeoxyribonuclease VII small subunit [Chloroflexota bacterium]
MTASGGAASFEELLAQLQASVAELERADLSLEASVQTYERCIELANACTALLDNAELRISSLRVETPRLREQSERYVTGPDIARRLLLGEDDDDLDDLLDDE